MKNLQQQIDFWKTQYNYCISEIKEYDNGKIQIPTTIQAYKVGARQDCVIEANYAASKLKELGVNVPIVS
jgi:hypothetical protein